MKSLTSIEEILQNWPELKECINSLSVSKSSTTSVEGIQGSFFSYFTKAFSETFKFLEAFFLPFIVTSCLTTGLPIAGCPSSCIR